MSDSEQILGRASVAALDRARELMSTEPQSLEPLDPGLEDDVPEFAVSARNVRAPA